MTCALTSRQSKNASIYLQQLNCREVFVSRLGEKKRCESDFRNDVFLEKDYAARFKEKRK